MAEAVRGRVAPQTRLLIVAAPPGSGTDDLLADLRSTSGAAPIPVTLRGCTSPADLDRRFVLATVSTPGVVAPAADARWIAIASGEDLAAPLLDRLADWIVRLVPIVRVVVAGWSDPAPLLERLGDMPRTVLSPADLAASDADSIEVGILDGSVRKADGSPVAIAGRPLEVLMFLALQPAGRADRSAIVDALWPDLSDKRGIGALKSAAHRIRVAFGDPRVVIQSENGYRIAAAFRTDIARLEGMLFAAGAQPDGALEIEPLVASFRAGVARLQGMSRWPWFVRYAARAEAVVRRLARTIAEKALSTGETARAHQIAADLRLLDESDETAYEISIEALRRDGDAVALQREIRRYAAVMTSDER